MERMRTLLDQIRRREKEEFRGLLAIQAACRETCSSPSAAPAAVEAGLKELSLALVRCP